MTNPHERGHLPPETPDTDNPAETLEVPQPEVQAGLDADRDITELPSEPMNENSHPTEDEPVAVAGSVHKDTVDASIPAVSRKDRRRARSNRRGRLIGGAATGLLVTGIAVRGLLGIGGDNPEESTQNEGDRTEEIAPNEAARANEDNPAVIENPEPTEESPEESIAQDPSDDTPETSHELQEGEDILEKFGPMTPEQFSQLDDVTRIAYALNLADRHGHQVPVASDDTPGMGGDLTTITNDDLLDTYNTLVRDILPDIYGKEGPAEGEKFMWGITADAHRSPYYRGGGDPIFEMSRMAWGHFIEHYDGSSHGYSGIFGDHPVQGSGPQTRAIVAENPAPNGSSILTIEYRFIEAGEIPSDQLPTWLPNNAHLPVIMGIQPGEMANAG